MPDDGNKGSEAQRTVEPLSTRQRAIASALGFALAGGGATSVYLTSNEAGSTTLIIFGCIFLLMALSGAPLQSLKIKDTEIVLAQVRQKMAEAVIEESTTPDEAQRLVEMYASADPGSSQDPAMAQAVAKAYERLVVDALRNLNIVDVQVYSEAQIRTGSRTERADALIQVRHGEIAVFIRYARGLVLDGRSLSHVLDEIRSLAGAGLLGILVITNVAYSPSAEARIRSAGRSAGVRAALILWSGPRDDEGLEAQVRPFFE
jgi:hypothetical protein